MLQPMNQLERNGAEAPQEQREIIRGLGNSIDLSEPVDASLFSDGTLKLSDIT